MFLLNYIRRKKQERKLKKLRKSYRFVRLEEMFRALYIDKVDTASIVQLEMLKSLFPIIRERLDFREETLLMMKGDILCEEKATVIHF
ncbi:hypothetical protein L596_017704 [Steinernema carpocapsae]|uniref:Uncharacterized protein n=1 Tax=Steinernema carpocapsae TaxID=34508 RepID=A0A4U5N2S3_STECR|nr:hypothetical protein L596_017704 [Steinernema carpocapsae]